MKVVANGGYITRYEYDSLKEDISLDGSSVLARLMYERGARLIIEGPRLASQWEFRPAYRRLEVHADAEVRR